MTSRVLETRSIVEALSCLQVGVTVEDIANPTPDRVQTIYHAFCTQILDVPERSLAELPFECELNPETAEIHQKSTPLLLLFTTMRCFIVDFGDADADFTMCDLVNPQPKRTRKLLSVVAAFTNYYKVASQVFEKTSSEYDEARKAIEDGQEQIRLAELRKRTLRGEQDTRRRKENELLAEYNSKNTILTGLIKEAEANEQKRDAILASLKGEKEQKANLLVEIKSLQNEIEHLAKGIVSSPDRVRHEADSQREQIKRLQADCKAERDRISENIDCMKTIENTAKALDGNFKMLEKIGDIQVQISLLEHNLSQAKALLEEAIRRRQQTADDSDKLTILSEEEIRKHERSRELYSSRLEHLKTKKEELIDAVKALKESDPSVRGEVLHIKNEMQRLGRERIDETKNARIQCLELMRRFSDLIEKYRAAEELFDARSTAFIKKLQSLNDVLDEAEKTVDVEQLPDVTQTMMEQ
ncbi:hypothetical protein RB195_008972 [Necator americanus]